MHATGLLAQWLAQHSVIGHRAREAALLKLVQALLGGSTLSLTQLGRYRPGAAYAKHHIKAANRLLSNRHLHAERDGIYRAIARTLLAGTKRPLILVDWSDADLRRRWLMIKAAVAVGGRAVTLYERVYPMKRYNSPRTHREFLEALRTMLPDGCKPLIVTEAGYMSVDGTNILPGDWSLQGPLDHQEQADAYQALFESFQGHDWWQGVFWWSLSTDPNQGGADDRAYSFHDKPAEAVLTRFFSGSP